MKGRWGKVGSNGPWRPLQHQTTIVMLITFLKLMKMWGLISLIMLKKLHLAKILNFKLGAHKKKLILKISIKLTQYIPLSMQLRKNPLKIFIYKHVENVHMHSLSI